MLAAAGDKNNESALSCGRKEADEIFIWIFPKYEKKR